MSKVENVEYDFAVLIGRFQPFHNGHKALLQRASSLARNTIVLVGSAYSPRNIKNPFTFAERKEMILSNAGNVGVFPLRDFKYNDQKWIVNVQKIVLNAMYDRLGSIGNDSAKVKIAVIGLNKDDSTNYLTWFPTWTYLETKPVEQEGLDATSIRDLLFGGKPLSFAQGVVPPTTYEFLVAAKNLPWWKNLEDEFEFVKAYKKSWEAAPYPPTFVTVDAVVVQDGHVLMVKRGANPGKGLLALPGGFVNQNERLEDAVIRELREETRLKVPEPVLKGSVVTRDVFDAPDRSLRGRTITHATLFVLKSVGSLPVVKGGDDAEKAMWIPIANLNESEIFEDHYAIIQTMIDKI